MQNGKGNLDKPVENLIFFVVAGNRKDFMEKTLSFVPVFDKSGRNSAPDFPTTEFFRPLGGRIWAPLWH
jgi:hypothetical protein